MLPRLRIQTINSKAFLPFKRQHLAQPRARLGLGQVGTEVMARRKEPGAICRSVLAHVLRRYGYREPLEPCGSLGGSASSTTGSSSALGSGPWLHTAKCSPLLGVGACGVLTHRPCEPKAKCIFPRRAVATQEGCAVRVTRRWPGEV